ncbi:MAG: hypothetical protein H0V57_05210, partial [Thermoleophilaceae bacterium]|nr:hypothetical protein [Thermoleophilaceae bacterium]
MSLRCRIFVVLALAIAAFASPASASAGEVIEVDGSRAERQADPYVPEGAESRLPEPRGGGAAAAAP